LAAADWGGKIRLLDLAKATDVRELAGDTAAVQSLGFSPNGSILLSRSLDGTLRQWDIQTGRQLSVLKVPQ
jgi:WD40 repeat protein